MSPTYLHAEFCECPEPKDLQHHIWGEPSDLICLLSPITDREVS